MLARTTLRADPACLLVPRGHPFWEKESVPLAELRNQRVLLPSLRQDLVRPAVGGLRPGGLCAQR
ncbi:MAG: hypothetical protein ACLVJH_10350 [Faecalibacterium prausnitzii]